VNVNEQEKVTIEEGPVGSAQERKRTSIGRPDPPSACATDEQAQSFPPHTASQWRFAFVSTIAPSASHELRPNHFPLQYIRESSRLRLDPPQNHPIARKLSHKAHP